MSQSPNASKPSDLIALICYTHIKSSSHSLIYIYPFIILLLKKMYLKSLALVALFADLGLASTVAPPTFPTGPFPPATTTTYDTSLAERNGFIFEATTSASSTTTTTTCHTSTHHHHSSSCSSSSESECSSESESCSSHSECCTSESECCTSEYECCISEYECCTSESECEEKIIIVPCPTCPTRNVTSTVSVLPTSAAVLPTSAAVLPTQQVLPVCTPCTNFVTVTTTPAMACTTMVFCDIADQSENCIAQNNQQIEKIVSEALRNGGQVFVNGQLVVFSTAESGSGSSGGSSVASGSTLITVTGQQANMGTAEVATWGSSILAMAGAVAFYLFAL